jgi:hypothetical protein
MGWVDQGKIAAFKIVDFKQLIGSTVFLYPHQLNDTSLACKVAEGDNDVLKLVVLSH